MAPRVAGQVTKLLFADNQHVSAGQTLVLIDPRDFQAKLDQAKAQQASAEATLQQAQAQVLVQQANVDQATANVRVAEADLLQARQDYDRFQKINPNAVTRQQIDAATATFHSSQAKLDASRQMVGGAQAQVRAAQAQVLAAQASLQAGRGEHPDGGTATLLLHHRRAGGGDRDPSHRRCRELCQCGPAAVRPGAG